MTKAQVAALATELFKEFCGAAVMNRVPITQENAQRMAEESCMAALKMSRELENQDLVDRSPAGRVA